MREIREDREEEEEREKEKEESSAHVEGEDTVD